MNTYFHTCQVQHVGGILNVMMPGAVAHIFEYGGRAYPMAHNECASNEPYVAFPPHDFSSTIDVIRNYDFRFYRVGAFVESEPCSMCDGMRINNEGCEDCSSEGVRYCTCSECDNEHTYECEECSGTGNTGRVPCTECRGEDDEDEYDRIDVFLDAENVINLARSSIPIVTQDLISVIGGESGTSPGSIQYIGICKDISIAVLVGRRGIGRFVFERSDTSEGERIGQFSLVDAAPAKLSDVLESLPPAALRRASGDGLSV